MLNLGRKEDNTTEEDQVVRHFEEGFRILARRIARVIIQEFENSPTEISGNVARHLATNSGFPLESKKLTYSVVEAAELLGLSRPAAYEAVRTKQIPSIRFGRRIIIPRHALEKLLYEVT